MTAPPAATVRSDMEILRKYAAGGELGDIAKQLAADPDHVAEVAAGANWSRGRAGELVRQHEAATRKPTESSPRREPTRTAPTALVSGTVVSEPVKGEEVAAGPVPAGPAATSSSDVNTLTVLALLARAEANPRLAARAAKVRAAIDDLRAELAEAERVAAAERRVEELRAELAEATEALRKLARPGSTAKDGPDPREVRAWAQRSGVAVPASGRVSRTVIAQYCAAHGLAAP